MKAIFAVFALFVALSVTQAALGQVRIRTQATVEDNVITLGDLFTGVGDLAEREVGPAPEPGHRAIYRAEHLMAIARAHDLPWHPSSSVSRTVVRRGGEVVDEAEISELLRREFRQKGAVGRVKINLNRIRNGVLRPPKGSQLLIEALNYDAGGGAFSAYVYSDEPDATGQRQLLRGRVEFLARVPVANRAIRKGQTITDADIKWAEISLRTLGSDTVEHPEQVVGLAAKRNLRLNQPIKQSELRTPIVIAKGSTVTITLKTRGISLGSTGRALEDGSLGETIQIMNIQSKRTVEASVVAPNHVTVTMRRQIAAATPE